MPHHRSRAIYIVNGVLCLGILGLATGVIDLGIPVVEVLLMSAALAMMVAFGRFTFKMDEIHEEEARKPRNGVIHHASGVTSPVKFIPTEDPSTFIVKNLQDGPVLMREGDTLEPDFESPHHEFVFANTK